jgi:NodT family efflux transporter outer membrane factor (OMF) lipoprotein
MHRPIVASVLLLLLCGCTMGPDFKSPEASTPETWTSASGKPAASMPVEQPIDPNWWNLFRDRELTTLEEHVATENLDVRVATIRLAESRAQLGVVMADLYPNFEGNASYQRQKASNNGEFSGLAAGKSSSSSAANGAAGNSTGGVQGSSVAGAFDIYQYGFDSTWELDLWGKVRRAVEAADANVTGSAETRRDTLLTSLAEVARDYLQLRGTQVRLQIARDNLKSAQQSQELTRERAAGGVTTDLDVANASAQVATFAAEIPSLEQQERQLINALSLLLGQPPQALRAELMTPRPVPPVPPRIPVGLPSELARRRPDIRQAEAQLHLATATIGVAEANFYPSFTLGGSVGIQGLQIAQLFDLSSLMYALGPSITIPIFEGGRLKSTLELRQQQQKEAAVVYQRTVLNAWHEIDNSMTAYVSEQHRHDQLAEAVLQNERAVSLAQSRYEQGVSDFLQVLDAQRSLFITQQSLAQSTTTIDTDLVAIYKALGGGWETDFPDQRTVAEE